MTKDTTTAPPVPSPATPRRRLTLERTFVASLDEVWELWTTAAGIEAWWGPEGFTVKVHALDLRPGGEMRYAMTATGAEQAAFMKGAGMPLTTEARLTYTEIAPTRRLAYTHVADFVPGVAPYDIATVVEFHPGAHGVRMVLTFDAMHEDRWTQMAVMGWESQLGKLANALAGART